MANTINYTLPSIGSTPDPTWESLLNSALTAISTHTHDGLNAGALLAPAAVTFTGGSGFNFGNTAQTNAAYYDVAQQSGLPAQTAGHGRFACDTSGNLYYVSPSANVLLASATAINYSSAAKGFVGADYGSAGGAAFFNNASATWPYNTMFYLYTAAATPSNDTGTRAGLGCGFLSIKATGYNCAVNFTDPTGGGSGEYGWWGFINQSLGTVETRLDVSRSSSTTFATSALCVRETSTSASTLSNTATIGARTYGVHINGSPAAGTSNAFYHFTLRANYPGVPNNTVQNIAYVTRNHSDGTGAIATVASGFGMRHCWNLQPPGAGAYGIGNSGAAEVISWDNAAGGRSRYGFFVAAGGGGLLTTPGLEIVANSSGTNSVGIGVSADATTVSCGIGMNTAITGTLTTSSALTVSSGGATITGNIGLTGSLTASVSITCASLAVTSGGISVAGGGVTIAGGGAAITGAVSVTGTLTATALASAALTSASSLQLTSNSGDMILAASTTIVRPTSANTHTSGSASFPWAGVYATNFFPSTGILWSTGWQKQSNFVVYAALISAGAAVTREVNNMLTNTLSSCSQSGGTFTITFTAALPSNVIISGMVLDNGMAGGIGIVSAYQSASNVITAITAISGSAPSSRTFSILLLSAGF